MLLAHVHILTTHCHVLWTSRYPHLKKQGRCAVFKREPPEGEDEDSMELTEEEAEEGPEPLAPLEGDAEVAGAASWTPLFSSSAEHVKNQVGVTL